VTAVGIAVYANDPASFFQQADNRHARMNFDVPRMERIYEYRV